MAVSPAAGTTEVELKIAMDAADEARLRRHPALSRLRSTPRRTEKLVSVYYDSPDHALAKAGIALRLRKVGRAWVQTVKFGKGSGGGGLFSRQEIDHPAPGGRLVLDAPDPEGVFAAIRDTCDGAALSPVFETRVRRIVERLRLEDSSEIEVALDHGEVVAGELCMPLHEAEIELVSGEVGAVYDVAQTLFPTGPVRFSAESKAARGYALAEGAGVGPPKPRGAGALDYDRSASVESVARDVFRDCHAQIAANLVVVADSDAIEGPHQLRIGLRRLRSAISVFSGPLGREALDPISQQARDLGQVVGRLRDIDVLIDEVVADAAAGGLDPVATGALTAALETRRETVRAEVRRKLATAEATGLLYDLGRLIEGRGWLSPSDYSQTGRLAEPIGAIAPGLLDKRHGHVMKRGRKIRKLSVEELHELRKELKKFRYAADVLDVIWPGKKVGAYIKSLKRLQDMFGTLNDAAMAGEYLTGPDAPGQADPAVQRAVGWVLGTLAIRVGDDRPALFDRWDDFAAEKPFWR